MKTTAAIERKRTLLTNKCSAGLDFTDAGFDPEISDTAIEPGVDALKTRGNSPVAMGGALLAFHSPGMFRAASFRSVRGIEAGFCVAAPGAPKARQGARGSP
jgi:hypothetical protein